MKRNSAALAALLFLAACAGGGSESSVSGGTVNPETACTNNPAFDSTINGNVVTRIDSHLSSPAPRYASIIVRNKADGTPVTMDYMVHEAVGAPKGMVVLVAGGTLDAGITGTGATVTASGANFLVRSAHLFASQGYRVVTIDRPDDFSDFTGGNPAGGAYDGYRTSPAHGVDLAGVSAAENNTNLPVMLAGTSRGAISVVAQSGIVSAILVSSPVTSGGGIPVGSAALPLSAIAAPMHVLWHAQDGCSVTPPAGTANLVQSVAGTTGDPVSGGFDDPAEPDPCQARRLHGFLGIELCAVSKHAVWLDARGIALVGPTANAIGTATTIGVTVRIDLASATAAGAGGALTHSLAGSSTPLGGTVSISGATVTYTPPNGVSGTTDRFAYVVREANGTLRSNVVSVAIAP